MYAIIKPWLQMEAEFGTEGDSIDCHYSFTPRMEQLLPSNRIIEVNGTHNNNWRNEGYSVSKDMVSEYFDTLPTTQGTSMSDINIFTNASGTPYHYIYSSSNNNFLYSDGIYRTRTTDRKNSHGAPIDGRFHSIESAQAIIDRYDTKPTFIDPTITKIIKWNMPRKHKELEHWYVISPVAPYQLAVFLRWNMSIGFDTNSDGRYSTYQAALFAKLRYERIHSKGALDVPCKS
jgi:hypothetical protein